MKIVQKYLQNYLHSCPRFKRIIVKANKDRKQYCLAMALIHYQAIYGQNNDSDNLENSNWNDCIDWKLNNSKRWIVKWIEKFQQENPSTRNDDNYWNNFLDCSDLFLQNLTKYR